MGQRPVTRTVIFAHAERLGGGVNPDGTHYDDPGIRWISYFQPRLCGVPNEPLTELPTKPRTL